MGVSVARTVVGVTDGAIGDGVLVATGVSVGVGVTVDVGTLVAVDVLVRVGKTIGICVAVGGTVVAAMDWVLELHDEIETTHRPTTNTALNDIYILVSARG
jgi:hypothetical protein